MNADQHRAEQLDSLASQAPWDILIIGGGASGLGAAVDAAARGYRTLLVEARDFASGTSSCSTKLIHGGVRYLRQGDFSLVRDALHERGRLLRNAPHLAHPLSFIIPARHLGEQLFYGAGLRLYDLLAGAEGIAPSSLLGRAAVQAALPGLRDAGVRGGVRYWDGQFDDARLAIALMRTARQQGATCLNYLPVVGLIKQAGKLCGAQLRDAESGREFAVTARCIINATGVGADRVRALDHPGQSPLLTPSQGIHLVLDRDFLPGNEAILVPKTDDGRVMFAIPWLGKVLIGTTDTPRPDLSNPDDPEALSDEIDFLLEGARRLLRRAPQHSDLRSVFAGLRPLANPSANDRAATAALSREHTIVISDSGLITLTGGKWTTYRLMAEQVVDRAARQAGLTAVPCPTRALTLFAGDAAETAALPGVDCRLHPRLSTSEAEIRQAIRHESARTIEDVLARRSRALFLDAAAAREAAPRVGALFAEELGWSAERVAAQVAALAVTAQRFLPPDRRR